MGTILQQRVPQQCRGRLHREQGCRKAAMWSERRPGVDRYKTDRLQSQKKSEQPPNTATEENINKAQPRRKHKSVTSSANRMSKHSSQVTSESKSPLANQVSHNKQKHTRPKSTRHTAVFPCHRPLSDSSPDPSPRLSTVREDSDPNEIRDDNSDLSESERLPELPSAGPPPHLDLRPEVIAPDDPAISCRHKHKAQFDFPDFLPPPFNSWNLSQLAIFYNMESRATSRPKPVGPLESYLERLLQLEVYQIQTWQDNTGTPPADPVSSSHRVSTSSRLSTPKCILQCQRAFPLMFLSSASSHCAYVLCRTRYPSCCCRSSQSQARPSRFSPTQERKGPTSVPKRSYSETRVPSVDRAHKLTSPGKTSGHLNWMQAAGNIRTSVQGANNKLHSTAKDLGPMGDVLDHRTGGVRTRSGSEHRKVNVERQHNCSEKRRGRSECRKGRAERRAQQEIKPDAVTAIMDNLPASKHCGVNRPARPKQVEFVT